MSLENVDKVRSSFDSFNRGDMPPTLFKHFDPAIAWHTSEDNPDTAVYHGREALAELIATWREMFEEMRIEPSEFIEVTDGVITPARVLGRGAASGARIDMQRTYRFELRDGRIVEVWEHRTKEEALQALGLSDQDAHADS
jgi:ketosteroid isomerase-like protein